MKVSAVVCNRDELWLEQSLSSIAGVVDEIVVVDASKKVLDKEDLHWMVEPSKFQFVHMDPCIFKQLDCGYMMASYPLVLRWDSDFVAHDGFDKFIGFLHGLDGRVAVHTFVKNVRENGDSNKHGEIIAVTYSSCLMHRERLRRRMYGMYRMVVGGKPPRFSHVPLPFNYWHHKFPRCVIDHMNTKPEWRDRERAWQVDWQLCSDNERKEFGCFEKYVERMIESEAVGDLYKFEDGRLPY